MNLKDKMLNYLQSDRKRSLYIPEFDETVYYTPVTVLEMEKIVTLSGGATITKDYHVHTIIEKLEDAEGKKIFSIEDKPFLEKLGWKIVTDISNKIHKTLTFDEAKKNSPITPS